MKEIFTRRSVREYDLSKKLSYDELLDIVKAGMAGPTARNQQSWTFMIIDDEAIIKELAVAVGKSTMNLLNANTYIAILGHTEGNVLSYGMQPSDLGAAQMNMMIYARSKNLGTCWIGSYGNKDREINFKRVLNVPDEYFVYSLMAIGYPKDLSCFKEIDRFDINKVFHNKF